MELETRKAAEPSLPRWQAVITALSVTALGTMDCEKVPCTAQHLDVDCESTKHFNEGSACDPTSNHAASLGLCPAETHSSLSLSFFGIFVLSDL